MDNLSENGIAYRDPNSQNHIIVKTQKSANHQKSSIKTPKYAKDTDDMRNDEIKRNVKLNTMARLKAQNKMLTILSTLVLFVGIATIMLCTLGGLYATKSAVGSITFDFKSPTMNVGSGLKMYCSNLDSSGNLQLASKITYGNDADEGQSSIDPYYISFSSNQTGINAYYVKLIYQFDWLDTTKVQSVSLGTSTLAFGAKTMSAPTVVSRSPYKFESVSNGAVATGATFDILGFMRKLSITFRNNEYTANAQKFSITVIVDQGNSFESSHKAQTVISGTIGYRNKEKAGELSDNASGGQFKIYSQYNCEQYESLNPMELKDKYDGEEVVFTTKSSAKLKFEIPTENVKNHDNMFYNKTYSATFYDDSGNQWSASLVTSGETNLSFTLESVNYISARSEIYLASLFVKAGKLVVPGDLNEGSYKNEQLMSVDNDICSYDIYCGLNVYADNVKIAYASLKLCVYASNNI